MSLPIKISEIGDENYPPLLKEIPGRPEKIFFIGNPPQTNEFAVAVVGTRKATKDGLLKAREISRDLSEAGVTVVSGLALGIDGAAHEGALAGGGRTIAVLANGLMNIYPRQHYGLARKITETGGCLISERKESTAYHDGLFLERNRIVSGLSVAVAVVEAPINSGAISTARHALDQGREVFVVPGNTLSQNYAGSHMLIREGARLVTNAKEIMTDLNYEPPIKKTKIEDESELLIFETVKSSGGTATVDKIAEITKLEPQIINQKLALLVLGGLVEEKNGKFYESRHR